MPDISVFSAILWFVAGLAAGAAHVVALWPNVQWFMMPGRRAAAVVVMAVRLLVLAAVLFLAARNGTASLLFAAFGVILARPVALRLMRRYTGAAPLAAIREENVRS